MCEVRGDLALRRQQLLDPAGQPVDRRPTSRTSGGPAGSPGPTDRRWPAGAPRHARSVIGRVIERANRSAKSSTRTRRTRPSTASTSQVRVTPDRAAARSARTPRSPRCRRCVAPAAPADADVGPAPRPRMAGARRPRGLRSPPVPRRSSAGRRCDRRTSRRRRSSTTSAPAGPGRPRDQRLALDLGRVQRVAAAATRADQGRPGSGTPAARRGRRGDQQGDLAPSLVGLGQPTPTPRTVCRYAARRRVSPSLRRSQDRWTSTVLSAPPYGSRQTSASSSRLVTTVAGPRGAGRRAGRTPCGRRSSGSPGEGDRADAQIDGEVADGNRRRPGRQRRGGAARRGSGPRAGRR